ncbi:hypothetical protein B9Z55_001253 [Caenorhabditis nigoni]|uniref:AB hydrolase-1 domain-containing protein n=2 Tax=Caenorhabditis nigoni TaxID=1611254 RepID=A0A2G5VEX1_9PELO|nr:hypothetical protein B9Z55_001253 [Caenorhabditis nigoni]
MIRRSFARFLMQNPKSIVTYGKKDTVVALLGWAGAADKNVAKYAGIYQKKGYTTVQYTAHAAAKGWGTKEGREVENLAQTLDSVLINPSNRLIFHVFSMNGFLTLTSLDSQYPELKAFEKCDGIFLDSCPACFAFSFDNMYKHSLVMNHVYDGLIKSSNFLVGNFYWMYKKWETTRFGSRLLLDELMIKAGICSMEDANPFFYLLNHPHLPPIIYSVFSDADIVCSADEINSFNQLASQRSDKRREVVITRLKDSAHVEHFKKHPKLYLERMEEFLQKVEKFRNGGNSKL